MALRLSLKTTVQIVTSTRAGGPPRSVMANLFERECPNCYTMSSQWPIRTCCQVSAKQTPAHSPSAEPSILIVDLPTCHRWYGYHRFAIEDLGSPTSYSR